MNRSRSGDEGPDDRLITEAYAALDGTIPDGYFDDFSSRVLARLDETQESGMEGRSDLARGSGVTRPDEAPLAGATPPAEPAKREEHSGLHEIKALASNTRRRLSQRISSQQEAEDSLLVASSGSFKSVALPDPSAAKPMSVAPLAATPAAAPAAEPARAREERRDAQVAAEAAPVAATAEPARFRVPPKPSSAPWRPLGGVATVAAAAAVAVFVFGVGRGGGEGAEPDSTLALAETAEVAPGAPADPPAASGAAAVPPAASAPAVTALDSAAAEAEPAPAPEPGEGRADRADDDGRRARESSRSARTARAEARPSKDEAPKADEVATEKKDADKAAKPQPSASGEGQDLEDVLNQVTGGVDAPKETEEEPKKPAKKELDRRDVANAMGGVRGEALKCYSVEQYQGTVTARFTVEPSGKVSEVSTDKKGPTGACVAKAVKKARFPAFDGAPTSFTYPFLLAE